MGTLDLVSGARQFSYLSYADAPAALRWLEAVGFQVVRRQDDGDLVVHAELRLGDAVIMVASDDEAYLHPPLTGLSTGRGVYLLLDSADEVDGAFSRAVEAGGSGVLEPHDTEWGTRRARVIDPGDAEWTWGTYEPGASW